MPASNVSDDAEMSMMDDASNSSLDALFQQPARDQLPATPVRSQQSIFPSEPTPPHTGPEPRLPSLNANGKRALPTSNVDLRSQATLDLQNQAVTDALGGELSAQVPPAPGMKWQAGNDGILVEVPDGEVVDEPGMKWKSRKGQDEMRKAMEQIVDREYMIKKKYGDVVMNPRRMERQS